MKKRIAIVGGSFRFPGTQPGQHWDDLLHGRDLVTTVDASRWAKDAFYHPNKAHGGTAYTFAAGSIGDVNGFDAGFFGISPREASQMDPQQRLLLEMSWEALENSGIPPSSLRGSRCGVFIGIASADYSYRLADDLAAVDSSVATGNTASIAANRLSYFFDLHGPSMAIDTACSSSLVAFHQACQSIVSGESVAALTGGISLHYHPYGFIIFSKASMLSKRGRCNVFDANGDGYVRSEGGGMMLLKEYDQAVADGDPILAVVAHTAINTDGRKSGLTVPNPRAQADLLINAYRQAEIDPAEIDYIEAHGTGTAVGDPIETLALGEALGKRRARDNPLLIGSVKSNLGHMEAASGVAGLFKAIYSLQHRVVPATIGITTPNPNILFDDWNVRVVTENHPLKPSGRLVIGVNSFGFGGANAHVILENHSSRAPVAAAPVTTPLPLLITAKSDEALQAAARELADFARERPAADLYPMAWQALFKREWHDHRAVLFGECPRTIGAELAKFASGDGQQTHTVESGTRLEAATGPAFVYSGNGSQWAGMGQGLLADPVFREALREIDAIFNQLAPFSLEEELVNACHNDRYGHTEIAQPTLFAVQVGITRMLQHRGIHPVAVTGHSVGEVAAAWACGALSLEAAVRVIYHRSRLQGETKGCGQMTAVGLGHGEMQTLLAELGLSGLCLAGVNSPKGVTVAGEPAQLALLEAALNQRNIFQKRLDLDYAFHSPAMDTTRDGILEALSHLATTPGTLPFHSTVTGQTLDGAALDASYWWRNIRQPVLFEKAILGMLSQEINTFVEIGPHPVLRSYINDCIKEVQKSGRVIPTVVRNDDTPQRVWGAVAQVMITGCPVNWNTFFPTPGRFIALPNYPWQREALVHTVTSDSIGLLYRHKVHPLLGYRLPQQEFLWESQLDTQTHPTLADHVVGDAIVFPGSGFAELAIAAARLFHGGDFTEIEELEIRTPLLLSHERSKVVRVAIDPQDGALTIKAREHLSEDPWVVHAVGRIPQGPREFPVNPGPPALPSRAPDFDRHRHQVLTSAAGLQYGPAFQAIHHGWVDDDSVLAIFQLPGVVEEERRHHHLHPVVLDSAFQLMVEILHKQQKVHQDLTFVPTKMGRIVLGTGQERPHMVQVTLRRSSPHSLLADVFLFDAAGRLLAHVQEARLRSIRLHKSSLDQLRYLDYHAIPRPHPQAPVATAVLDFDEARQALDIVLGQCVQKGLHARYTQEIEPLLDGLCSRFTLEALLHIAGDSTGQRLHTAHLARTPFLDHILDMAREDGLIRANDNGWDVSPAPELQATAQDIWNSLVNDHPDYFAIIHAVGRVGMHLPSLLEHQRTVEQLLSRRVSRASLMAQVLGANGRQHLAQTLKNLLTRTLAQLPEGRRLGVLEISEGGILFGADLCAALDFDRSDYIFASPIVGCLEETFTVKEKYPAILCQHIGAESGDEPVLPCQLAIVTLDFMNIADALRALAHARAHLTPGGTLLVVGQHPTRWMDMIYGGLPGWWRESTAQSWISQQQPVSHWQQQLENHGFLEPVLLEFSPGMASGPWLLVARTTAVPLSTVAPSATPDSGHPWLLLADDQGYSATLARHLMHHLQTRGIGAILSHARQSGDLCATLRELHATRGGVGGIVHMAGLGQCAAAPQTCDTLTHQTERCATAAAILQAVEATQSHTTCWILTSGAMTHLLPQPRLAAWRNTATALADAALWGFGRTLLNEFVNGAVRLVDIEDPFALETVATALNREFAHADPEQEILLTANGERFAPRLRLLPRPDTRIPIREDKNGVVRLGFSLPGQLRNLRWEAIPAPQLAADQLEIQVHATGLNFRDVMYTLGLLSDEAVENGFAGASLGMEFAGVVLRTGAKTTGFVPGDLVVGFAPSSFSNRVITKASAVSHIPAGISFEAAATIPSTFFTAFYALVHLARLAEGEKVLIHGGAGGVGLAAIQIAKWCGAEIFATAGSDEKRDVLRLLGVEHILDSRSLAFADDILTITGGEGVDVVLNSLAGEAINRNLRILKPFGRFMELGKRDFYENTRIGLRPFRNNISYFGIDADQMMVERAELTRQLFAQIMGLFAKGELHPLPYHAFEADDVVDAFRYMQQSRQIGKVVITYRNGIVPHHHVAREPRPPLQFSPQASYLVTGGLAGFGLKTAQWLADKGARHLVLLGRSGAVSEEAREAVAALEHQGVRVWAAACDVTDRQALARLLQEVAAAMPPLRGIVHAAVVIEDALIRNLDAAQIQRVLAPKIVGAQNLHDLTREMALDLFVLYSSATTLFGNPGQGNYVAANVWLEALAHFRRGLGQPATCVCWGAIDDAGFLARNEKIKDALQNRMGGAALPAAVALDALEGLLQNQRSGEGVLDLDWRVLGRFIPTAKTPKFGELARQFTDGDGGGEQEDDLHLLLESLSDEELLPTVIDLLKHEVCEILRVSPDKIDPSRSIYEMGLDSLMGVELVTSIESRFGVKLPVMALSESPTISKLAERIIPQLRSTGEPVVDSGETLVATQIQQIAAQHAAEVSPELIVQMAEEAEAPHVRRIL